MKKYPFERKLLSSGISALDELLGGGIEVGTCTLITGPTGVGKSSLAEQFLATAAAGGTKCAIYTFEEGLSSILARSRSIATPLEDRLEDGTLIIREFTPLQLYPDELLDFVRCDIEQNGVAVFLLDSLRGYNMAMSEFGSPVAHMHNMVTCIRRKRASIFLTYEQEKITGDLQLTDLGVSYLVDNVLLVRLAEDRGQLHKVVSCIKKRLGPSQPDLLEFKITGDGIKVGPKLSHLRGLLLGVPTGTGPSTEEKH